MLFNGFWGAESKRQQWFFFSFRRVCACMWEQLNMHLLYLVQDNHPYYAATVGPKDISIEKYNRNSHIIKSFSERLELSFVYITRRLKPDFTVVFISLCSPLLHYRIWSLALLLIFWLFHETTKQETSLNSHKWVCLSPSLQFLIFFSPLCVSACFFWFCTSCNDLADMMVC